MMTNDQREAHVIIERARKAIRKDASNGTYRNHRFTAEQFNAICVLLHAGDYLRLGKPLANLGKGSAYFFREIVTNQPAPLPAHIPDFTVSNEGSIFILYAQTDAARAWVNEHLPADRQTWGGNGTVIEHRYICDIIDGIRADGLEVR